MTTFDISEYLSKATVQNNTVRLPVGSIDREDYLDVKKRMERIGGKWKGGKINAFVFEKDPTELMKRVVGGEQVNLKQEFQFFETPDLLANRLLSFLELTSDHTVLEPSAGKGALVKAINRMFPGMQVDCYELQDTNQAYLKKINTALLMGEDFIKAKVPMRYDRILANPPFSKNQDIDHILKMWDCLRPGGKLVSIASVHWHHSQNKKETSFRNWVTELNGFIYDVGPGMFKKSGTMVDTCIVALYKPEEK